MITVKKEILDLFACLSDETRLKIVLSLLEKPQSVNDIHAALGKGITLSAVSHQLKQLYQLGIINYEKKGRTKNFRLSDKFCWCILRDALGHFKENHCPACRQIKDEERLKK